MTVREAAPPLYRCFVCELSYVAKHMRRKGNRRDGSRWYLCNTCSGDWSAIKRAQRDEIIRPQVDDWHREQEVARRNRVSGVAMGWNGVPSERALRRRSR